MTRLRFRDSDKDNELLICKTARIISQAKTEEEKAMIRNRFEKVSHLLAPESKVNKDLEDFKLKHNTEIEDLKKSHNQIICENTNQHKEEIKKIKKIHEEERVKNSKEKEDLLNQRIEIEQEYKKISDQLIELKEGPPRLSYKVKLNIILILNKYEYYFFIYLIYSHKKF